MVTTWGITPTSFFAVGGGGAIAARGLTPMLLLVLTRLLV